MPLRTSKGPPDGSRVASRVPKCYGVLGHFVLVALLFAAIGPAGLEAQDSQVQGGRIAGTVADAETGRPVTSAEVVVEGPNVRVVTDLQGRYRTGPLEAGTYALSVSALGYTTLRQEGVVITDARTVTVSLTLTSAALALEGITVEVSSAREASSVAGMLRIRQAAPTLTDGVSAEQIGRAPDSDAGDAIARVTGVSVVDSKFVVVRGLGERYSNTLLNGAELSSPEPAKRIVPLDIFPASLLESLVTTKTATPNKPGDFAGGSVEIRTKDFPEERVLELKVSQGYNSASTFKDVAFYPRTFKDLLGFDGRGRELRFGPELSERFAESLRNEWTPRPRSVAPNLGLGVDYGDQFGSFERAVGLMLAVDYGTSTKYEPNDVFRFVGDYNAASASTGSSKTASTSTVDWGTVANLSFRLGPAHTLSFKNMLTREAQEYIAAGNAFDPETRAGNSSNLRFYNVWYVTRTFLQSQVAGQHRFGSLWNSTVDWTGTLSLADRDEPENRTITYVESEATGLVTPDGSKTNEFWFRFLRDKTFAGQVDWSLPLSLRRDDDAQIKLGGLARFKRRDFDAYLYSIRPPAAGAPDGLESLALPPEELFAPENLGRNMELVNLSSAGLPYIASEDLIAGYLMADLEVFPGVRAVGGVRLEQWDLSMTPGGQENPTVRSVLDVLPSGNVSVSLSDQHQLRAAVYQTVNRPDPRELSSTSYASIAGECSNFGNPDLRRSKIVNADLRWEWYPGSGEIISVGGFFKRFDDPIVQVARVLSFGCNFIPANVESAVNFGAELEVRKSLGFVAARLANVTTGFNFTFVDGEVVPGTELFGDLANLPLQDQSRYLLNANAGYDAEDGGLSASVLINFFDDRVRRYGFFSGQDTGATRAPDVFELGRTTLDAKIRKRIGGHLSISLSGNNLTNSNPVEYQRTALGDFPVGVSVTGTSVSLSVSYRY